MGVFSHARFRWLAIARTTGFLGNAIAPIALSFAVLDLGGSVTDLGIVVGARSIANIALLLVGGVLADRWPRALLLQGSSALAAATSALMAVSVLAGFASVPLLAGIGLVNGAVAAIALPASYSITPETVPAENLQQANAILRIGTNSAAIVGAPLGGLLAATAGPGWAMVVIAAAFAVEATCYVRVGGTRTERARSHMLTELREGWSEFFSRRWVWVVVLQFMVVNAAFVGGEQVLGPVIADETFGRAAWGVALASQTAGAVVGGLVAARWLPRRALLFGVVLVTMEAAPLLALGLSPHLVVLLPAMFLCGIALEQFTIAWDLSLQENVPSDKLARVYSYDMIGSYVAVPVGQLAVGPVAAVAGPAATLVGSAVLIVVVTAAALTSRQVRELRRVSRSPEPTPADQA
ncbi:MFS transporter [Actinophytocola sp.]|uniref:MFS transporter n=1 Tax=Actinophytocola sp. TaxID=1872138 RepID=UPI002ED539DC